MGITRDIAWCVPNLVNQLQFSGFTFVCAGVLPQLLQLQKHAVLWLNVIFPEVPHLGEGGILASILSVLQTLAADMVIYCILMLQGVERDSMAKSLLFSVSCMSDQASYVCYAVS